MLLPLPYHPQSIAESIYDVLDQAVVERGFASLAIPGGRSPGAVLEALAELCDERVRAALHLFWVDERAVPPGDADRNDAATLAAWERGGALPAYVHAMPAEEADLEAAASTYAECIQSVCGAHALDVCLLGIGEDGHFASLFPAHDGLSELSPVFAIYDSPKPPAKRLSISLAMISACKQCHILALGEAKGAVFKAVRENGAQQQYPISLLPTEQCAWYLDEAARSTLDA